MDPRPPLYDPFVLGLRALSLLVPAGRSKVARGVWGRRAAATRLVAWGREERDPARPLAWFHAPSVGEGLQARAVMAALTRRRPDVQLAFTHFSPSAEGLARKMADGGVAGYLPWDVARELVPVVDALDPAVIVFTKTEVWPGLAAEAVGRRIPLALAAATLPPGAGRLRWPARRLLRGSFAALDRVLAIAADDGRRFGLVGVPAERVRVTGDPAIDSAWRRAREADPGSPHLAPFRDRSRPTVVAGSTWGPDEAVLVPALGKVREAVRDVRVIMAPHEPTDAHVEELTARLSGDGWSTATLAAVEAGEGSPAGGPDGHDAVVVDRVGVLADLYTVGHVAMVGGGFHRHGLHSVLEPAAAGAPVIFGPRHGNARAAGELAERGGARLVRTADEAAWILQRWLTDEGERDAAGTVALEYIEAHRGAAAATARALEELLPAPASRPAGGEADPDAP